MAVGAVSLVLVLVGLGAFSLFYFQFFYHPSHFEFEEPKKFGGEVLLTDVVDGVHVPTGLKADVNVELVVMNCTGCHSAKLITQNRATSEGWDNLISWMQETQNLWDLGENREKIIRYLSTNYAPDKVGRRKPLTDVEWYSLE